MIKQDLVIDIGDDKYTIGRVDAIEQFHLFRRLGPVLATMGMEMFRLLSGSASGQVMSKTDWIVVAAPLVGEVAKMDQADVDYLIQHSLCVVRRRQGDAWAPLLDAQGGLMFADMGMVTMLRLILEVLRHNLGDFFPVPQAGASS